MSRKRSSEDMLPWRGLALIVLASILLLSFSGLAQASTPAIDKATSQLQALRDLISQLNDELSAATEDYDYANQHLADTEAAVAKTSKELDQVKADLAVAQDKLNQRVVDIYKSGDVTLLAVLLGATSFTDLVNRFEQLTRISRQDALLVQSVKEYKAQVADHKAKLDSEMKQQNADAAQTAAAKLKVLDQLAKQKQALKGKEAQIAQLKKEDAARQAALAAAAKKAAELAAQQEAAAKAAAAKATSTSTSTTEKPTTTTSVRKATATTSTSLGGKPTTTTLVRKATTTTTLVRKATTTSTSIPKATTTTTTSGPKETTTTTASGSTTPTNTGGVTGADIVNYAMKFLGVPYVWGGCSPSGFDCSGLVKYVYGHFGIYLPHSSAMQYSYGTYVSQSQLKPGDLVFFYNPIHHVGIYIGNGNMINATGDQVQIGTVYKSSYTGARRILN